jgi:hypothetical protein
MQKKKKKNPSLWLVLSLNNPENHKLIFKKCPCESDENGEYFTSLMTKFVNTTHRHLYKQPPFASNYTWHLFVFHITSEIDCLGGWLFPWSSRCMNIVTSVCSFYLMDNLDHLCVFLMMRNKWDIPSIQKVWPNNHGHGCATSDHAFYATIYNLHPIFSYVYPTYDKLQQNSKFFRVGPKQTHFWLLWVWLMNLSSYYYACRISFGGGICHLGRFCLTNEGK